MTSINTFDLSLRQGSKFMHLQRKKYEENARAIQGIKPIYSRDVKKNNREGFTGLQQSNNNSNPIFDNSQEPIQQQYKNYVKANDKIDSKEQQELSKMQLKFDQLKAELVKEKKQQDSGNAAILARISPSNPYLNKLIKFNKMHGSNTNNYSYVTNRGIAKPVSQAILKTMLGIPIVDANIPWDIQYEGSGITIPTKPPLITGSPVQANESLGNEGTNVRVSSIVNNPSATYVGCYNNNVVPVETNIVPLMSATNTNVNGFIATASSTYSNSTSTSSPGNAFDDNFSTMWTSNSASSSNAYNVSTGIYSGTTTTSVSTPNGTISVAGEWLAVAMPSSIAISSYTMTGNTSTSASSASPSRDPNTWTMCGLNSTGQWTQIDQQSGVAFNGSGLTFPIVNSQPYSAYRLIFTVVGAPDTSTYRNCAIIRILNLTGSSSSTGGGSDAMTVASSVTNSTSTNNSTTTAASMPQVSLVPTTLNTNTSESNGFSASASSSYGNNLSNPGAAFDGDPTTFWNSNSGSTATAYNVTDGTYPSTAVSVTSVTTSSGTTNIGGEYLEIAMPSPTYVSSYTLQCSPSSSTPIARTLINWILCAQTSSSSTWTQIDQQSNVVLNVDAPTSFSIASPQLWTSYRIIGTLVGPSTATNYRDCIQIAIWDLIGSVAPTGSQASSSSAAANNSMSSVSLATCQSYALENGYSYYGINNSTGSVGQCMVSNDAMATTQYGSGDNNITSFPIWESGTSGKGVVQMTVDPTGAIVLLDSSQTVVWSSPNAPSSCVNGGNINIDSLTATYGANCTNYPSTTGTGNVTAATQSILTANSTVPFQITTANFGDPAEGCYKSWDLSYQCGSAWKSSTITADAAAGTSSTGQSQGPFCGDEIAACVFNLQLSDSGNMILYTGSDPSSNETIIWQANINGKPVYANPAWVATNDKYGRNYMKIGEGLSQGEFVSSPSGYTKLALDSTGNLVLYACKQSVGCVSQSDGYYGKGNINSVYRLNATGDRNMLGNIGFVSPDSALQQYPSSMTQYSNNYTMISDSNSAGNTIDSFVSTNGMQACENACSSDTTCAGYAFNNSTGLCETKTSAMYPNMDASYSANTTLGVRENEISGASATCSSNMVDIDSNTWSNYIFGNTMTSTTSCEPALNTSSVNTTRYNEIKTELAALGPKIAARMERLYNADNKVQAQIGTNTASFRQAIAQYNNIQQEMDGSSPSGTEGMSNLTVNDINAMLTDSDIRVLQSNYSYTLWSIVAVGVLAATVGSM